MTTGFTGHPAAVDADGAFYFSDQDRQSVRRIGVDGIITTVAGPSTGAPIVTREGSPSTTVTCTSPTREQRASGSWTLRESSRPWLGPASWDPTAMRDRPPQARIQAGSVLVGDDGELYRR